MEKNDLYFVSIIAIALEQTDDPKSALKQAFEKIVRLGREPVYQEGYNQFCRFMNIIQNKEEGIAFVNDLDDTIIQEIMLELELGELEDTQLDRNIILELIHNHPYWKEINEGLFSEIQDVPTLQLKLVLEKDDQEIVSFPIGRGELSQMVNDLYPGNYFVLKLSSGVVLWEDTLSKKDLIWKEAFPGRSLDMAASTEKVSRLPSREISLLEGNLLLRICPGVESGSIEIIFKDPDKN